jgi:preprotein translocase subunit SecD
MKGSDAVKFFAVVGIIAILTFLAVVPNGTFIPGLDVTIPSAYDIRQAADLKGGIDAILVPAEGYKPSDKELESAKTVIERRLDNKQVMDRSVTIDKQKKRINVQIPLKKGATVSNPGDTIQDIGKTAELTFREVDETQKDASGNYLPLDDKIILTGKDVENATVQTDPQTNSPVVSLKLYKEGAKKFAEATTRLVGKPIAIFMDKQIISWPTVNEPITNGEAVINGQRSAEEASRLAAEIRSGSIPFALEVKQFSSISPTLGANALNVGVNAGIVALIVICLYMILYYRLPGILAAIALIGHTVIQLLFISWSGLTLSLPGIAAIILSIGMGVDANVIIFERVREELRSGKTLRSAIDVGFKRAFAAVLDGNVTTLISAVILYYFGTGPVKSFAITLALGVALSFLTAVTASRIMLKSISGLNIMKHRWLYGVKGGSVKNV